MLNSASASRALTEVNPNVVRDRTTAGMKASNNVPSHRQLFGLSTDSCLDRRVDRLTSVQTTAHPVNEQLLWNQQQQQQQPVNEARIPG